MTRLILLSRQQKSKKLISLHGRAADVLLCFSHFAKACFLTMQLIFKLLPEEQIRCIFDDN